VETLGDEGVKAGDSGGETGGIGTRRRGEAS